MSSKIAELVNMIVNSGTKLSEAELDQIGLPKLELPYMFENGLWLDADSISTTLILECPKCKTRIPTSELRGAVFARNNRACSIEGVAICRECHTIVPLPEFRFFDQGLYQVLDEVGPISTDFWLESPLGIGFTYTDNYNKGGHA